MRKSHFPLPNFVLHKHWWKGCSEDGDMPLYYFLPPAETWKHLGTQRLRAVCCAPLAEAGTSPLIHWDANTCPSLRFVVRIEWNTIYEHSKLLKKPPGCFWDKTVTGSGQKNCEMQVRELFPTGRASCAWRDTFCPTGSFPIPVATTLLFWPGPCVSRDAF